MFPTLLFSRTWTCQQRQSREDFQEFLKENHHKSEEKNVIFPSERFCMNKLHKLNL